LGFDRQSVLIKREAQALLSEEQVLVFEGESREWFLEANIDN